VLVANPISELPYFWKSSSGLKIFDMVDGYLAEKDQKLKDLLRGLRGGRISPSAISFTDQIKKTCRSADCVVVGSPEQAELIFPYNRNVHVILDDHSEYGEIKRLKPDARYRPLTLFWEGLGITLKHLITIAPTLDKFLTDTNSRLLILTNLNYRKIGNKYIKVDSKKELSKHFRKSIERVSLISWSIESVRSAAREADLALLPINTADSFALYKPENKLLIYWRLGLPVLASPIPSYLRIANELDMEKAMVNGDWEEHLQLVSGTRYTREDGERIKEYLMKFHSQENLFRKWDSIFFKT
jgi:hypothetical protein